MCIDILEKGTKDFMFPKYTLDELRTTPEDQIIAKMVPVQVDEW